MQDALGSGYHNREDTPVPAETSVASLFLHAYEEQSTQRREDWLRLAETVEEAWMAAGVAGYDLRCLVALAVIDQPLLDAALLRRRSRELQLMSQTLPGSGRVPGDLLAMAAGLRAIADLVEMPEGLPTLAAMQGSATEGR